LKIENLRLKNEKNERQKNVWHGLAQPGRGEMLSEERELQKTLSERRGV